MQFLKKIPIHPTFYLLALWFVFCGQVLQFATFVSVLIIHEYGHYFVSKKQGYCLERFYIAPYGACLNYKEKQFERHDEIKIALAGPMSNIVTAFASISLWWVFPSLFGYTALFVEESLLLAIFNLLPAYPLDGGRVVVAIISGKRGRNKAVKQVMIVNIVLSTVFFILFIVSWFYSFNPTFALAVIFLLSGLMQGEYGSKYKNSFLFKKKIQKFAKPKILLVNQEMTFNELLKRIDGDSYTIFEIITKKGSIIRLSETQVINFCVKYSSSQKISCLFDG